MKTLLTLTLICLSLTASAEAINQISLKKAITDLRVAQQANMKGDSIKVNQSLTDALILLSAGAGNSQQSKTIKLGMVKVMASAADCSGSLIESANSEHPEYSSGNSGYWKREIEEKFEKQCEQDGVECDFDSIQISSVFKRASTANATVVTNIGSCEITASLKENF